MMKLIRYILIVVGFVNAGMMMKADVTTPYSMYGYGILGDRATSMQRQMGGVGYAMRSGRQINVMNPASYASIDSLTFLFDIGADVTFLWSKEGDLKGHSTGGGLDYVTMQFPIWKYFGASIGMVPYSSVGYSFGNAIEHGASENQGSGGINQAYIGFAGQYAGVGLGLNVSYSFGSIINNVYATPENAGQMLYEHVMQIRDWDINFGIQYTLPLNRFNQITAGFTFAPQKSLHGNSWVTKQELTQESLPDTVGILKLNGNYYTAASYGVGLSYTHEKVSRFMIEADFTYQPWSKAKYSPMYAIPKEGVPYKNEIVFNGMDFADRMKVAVGAELVPKVRGSYMERVAYRIGAYFCNDYLNIMGNKVREYGVTCGFGFKTPQDKTIINLGFEWKQRAAHPQKLISENYFNITLGVNFNELWFWQRKIR